MSFNTTNATLPTSNNGTTHGILEEVRKIKMSPAVLGGMLAGIVSLVILVTLLCCLRSRREKLRFKRQA